MRSKYVRIFALLTALLLLVMIFGGCGSEKNVNNDTSTVSTNASTTVTTEQTSSIAEEAISYMISETPVELVMFKHNQGDVIYKDDMPVWQKIAEETNIKIKFKNVAGTWDDFNSALALEIATGAECDLYWGGMDELNRHGDAGAFIDIKNLVKENAPTIQKLLVEDKEAYTLTTSMIGKFYAVPQYYSSRAMYGFYVRQDWLDKLQLKAPETIDDWIAMLKAFRDQDPNGNNKADEIPYIAREKFVALLAFSSAFNTDNGFYLQGGKVVYGPAQQEWKDFLTFINLLYKEKLLDNEFYTRTDTILDQSIENNTIGSTFDWIGSVELKAKNLGAAIPGLKLIAVAPPYIPGKSKSGTQLCRDKVGGSSIAISINNKHPMESVKLMEYIYGDRGSEIFNYGIEGLTYTKIDGKPIFTDFLLKDKDGAFNVMCKIGAGNFPYIISSDASNQSLTNKDIVKARTLYDSLLLPKFPAFNFKYTEEQLPKIIAGITSVSTYQEEMYSKFILGQESLDNYDKFVAQLDKLGMPEMLTIVEDAYQIYIK